MVLFYIQHISDETKYEYIIWILKLFLRDTNSDMSKRKKIRKEKKNTAENHVPTTIWQYMSY